MTANNETPAPQLMQGQWKRAVSHLIKGLYGF